MPVIEMTMHESPVEQKKELIRRLTETAVEVTKIDPLAFTVFIRELDTESIGCAGKTLKEVRAEKN